MKKNEAEKKENEKNINDLQWKIFVMSNFKMLNSLDQQQQYSERKCVLIHRISDQKSEDLVEQALKIFRERETV